MTAGRGWRVRAYRSGDDDALIALFNTVFGRPITPAYWSWKLKTLPTPVETVGLAVDSEDRPIFQLAGIPVRFCICGADRLVMVAVDAMTAPSFRRQGILRAAGRRLFESWREAGVAMVLGLPNEQYNPVALGWESLFPLRWRVHPLRPYRLLARRLGIQTDVSTHAINRWWRWWWNRGASRPHAVTVRDLTHDDLGADTIWQRLRERVAFSVVRDQAWIRWRYEAAPHQRYRVFLAERAGDPVGFAAYGLTGTSPFARAVITEVCTIPGDVVTVRALVRHVARTAVGDGAASLATLAVPATWLDRVLRRMGFWFTPAAFRMACVRLDPTLTLPALRDRSAWCIGGGDFDVV